jgi:hypothetical protein
MANSGSPLNDTFTLFCLFGGSERETITWSATLLGVGVHPEEVRPIECQRLASWEADSLRELAANDSFQLLANSYFVGGTPEVRLSATDPESEDDDQFEILVFPTTLDAEEASSRLFALLDAIDSHGSALLRGAVLDVEQRPT